METTVFKEMYKGVPPWDIDRPQREFVLLEQAGMIGHRVLDVGCGTGQNAIYLAERGHEVVGIDIVETAIARAEARARGRGIDVEFISWDALNPGGLDREFDTVIDSGFFHALPDEDRPTFLRGLASVLRPGGNYLMLCFSENEPGNWGPRRVTREEIRSLFRDGWSVDWIRDARFETNLDMEAHAWLASITFHGERPWRRAGGAEPGTRPS